MNSAARLISGSTISRTWVVSVLLSNVQYGVFTLFVGVLMSALSVIYVTNVTRGFHANLQQSISERNRLAIEQSQLILEKNTWLTQARVQEVATHQLDMVEPDGHERVIVPLTDEF